MAKRKPRYQAALISVSDCADILGVTTSLILRKIREGKVEAISIFEEEGKRPCYRIDRDYLKRKFPQLARKFES